MSDKKKFYVVAPQGGGLHYFVHLTRKHFFNVDRHTYHCPLFNEYSAPIEDPELMALGDGLIKDARNRQMWDVTKKMWCIPNDITKRDISITHTHWITDVGQDDGIFVKPMTFEDFTLTQRCHLIKRSIGTSYQWNMPGIVGMKRKGIMIDNMDRWREYVNLVRELPIPVIPMARIPLVYYTRCVMSGRPFYKGVLLKYIEEVLFPDPNTPRGDMMGHYINEIESRSSDVPDHVPVVNYADLMNGKPTGTYLDKYSKETMEYNQRNLDLIKRYADYYQRS